MFLVLTLNVKISLSMLHPVMETLSCVVNLSTQYLLSPVFFCFFLAKTFDKIV